MRNIIYSAETKLKTEAFRKLLKNVLNQKIQESKVSGSEDKLQLVEQMGTLNR